MTNKAKKSTSIFIFSILFLAFVVTLAFALRAYITKKSTIDPNLPSEEAEKIEIIKNGATEYSVVFSSDTISSDAKMASSIRTLLASTYGVSISTTPDSVASTSNFEILLGQTNRPESAELLTKVQAECKSSDDLAWGYAVINGKLLYLANSNEAYLAGAEDFLAFLTNNNFVLSSDLSVIKSITQNEYKLSILLKKNEAFSDSQFNTDKFTSVLYKPMIDSDGNGYFTKTKSGEPFAFPTEGQHPRYLITANDVERIKEILFDGENDTSVYYNLVTQFWLRANTNIKDINYGEFRDQYKASGSASWVPPTGESYRFDEETLSVIEAKALAYLITKDEIYAYEAIVAIKNAILSLKYTSDLHYDTYHGASRVMISVAAVYDWCYDVLSETDKWHIIWGTAQILGPQMEDGMQYPPSGMNALSGHGLGPQLLRDWLSVATVFYDEAPDWYRYVAGRYFNEYVPAANELHKNGWISSGTANYAPLHIYNHLWAASVIYLATGERFVTDGLHQAGYYLISHILPSQNGTTSNKEYYFETGDGSRGTNGQAVGYSEYFLIAALYNDPVMYAQALEISNYHLLSTENINESTTLTMTHAYQLVLASRVNYNNEGSRDGIETIQYFQDPAGQMTAREAWDDPNSVAVLMRLVNKTTGNHQCFSHGTFQIYYKGLLAGTSGAYAKYGSDAHYYYHQETVSENGLLVFNPALASTDQNKPKSYFYSGSQRRASISTSSAKAWAASAVMAETLGAAYGYDQNGNAKYAYLAGDMTAAYDAVTVDYVGRRMFTLFTGDENFPVLFFTFDEIYSKNESFTKHWLLHTLKEPEINQDNLTATIINGEGKMYLESLYGADSIVKIGGEGRAWWVNGYFTDPTNKGSWDEKLQDFTDPENKGSWVEGKNLTDPYAKSDNAKNIWGRIELRSEGEKRSDFLTVLAVTDTENETPFEIDKFKTDDGVVYGAKFENKIIAFVTNEKSPAEKCYNEISFTSDGNGLYEYYITGLEAGTWQILVDGVSLAYASASSEGAMITFTAPSGEVTIKPGSDVIGLNGGKIVYSTAGGVLPQDAPFVYRNETDVLLPTSVTRGEDKFVGWYTSPTFEPETAVTAVPAGTVGTFKVYAKWITNFLNEDYTDSYINVFEGLSDSNGITYNGGSKKGSSFITKTDKNGVNYLEWLEGTSDPLFCQKSTSNNFTMLGSDEKCVSYTVKLALEPNATPMATQFRVIAKKNVNGMDITGGSLFFFTTNTKGEVMTHKGSVIATLSEEITTIRLVVDFKNSEMRYYDDEYNVIAADKFTPPSVTLAKDGEEFRMLLDEYLWYFYGATSSSITDAALRVYGIRVQDGDEFTPLLKPQTEGIKYNTGGAVLPKDAPIDFNADGSETILPTKDEFALPGFIFDGWYTTSTFDEGTKTTAAPAGSTGLYEVYAKWIVDSAFINEDYSRVEIDINESSGTHNGIIYNGTTKTGSSYKTVSENGKTYLLWNPGEKDSLIAIQNESSNIYTMSENVISYTFKFSKNDGSALPNFELKLIGKHTVDGGTPSSNFYLFIGQIKNGVFLLGSGTEPVCEIGNEIVEIRVALDFENGTITAYDETNEIIKSIPFPAIPESSGASTSLEWKNCFRSYLFYMRKTSGASDGAIKIHGIRIEAGHAFDTKV